MLEYIETIVFFHDEREPVVRASTEEVGKFQSEWTREQHVTDLEGAATR